MATTDPDADGEADQGEGRAGQLPPVGDGHDQVADAGDERGTDQGAGAAEAPDQPVRTQAPEEAPRRARGEEEPVGAFSDSPLGGGQQDQDAGLHPLQPGQGAPP